MSRAGLARDVGHDLGQGVGRSPANVDDGHDSEFSWVLADMSDRHALCPEEKYCSSPYALEMFVFVRII